MSHPGHYITKCRGCLAILGQCRCMDKDKEVRYDLCSTCKAKTEPCPECHERGYHKMDCSRGRTQLVLPVTIVEPELSFREMILERIEEIKTGHGKDLFSEPNRHGQPKGFAKYLTTKNWAELNDAELLREFEFLVMYSYRQR